MTSAPRRCKAMMTSLPSSPAPSSMTRVAEGESGVPRRMAGVLKTKIGFYLASEMFLERQRLQQAQQAALDRRGFRFNVENSHIALVDVVPYQASGDGFSGFFPDQPWLVAAFGAHGILGDFGDLAREFRRMDDQPHFGVESCRARIEVEAADEYVLVVEHEGLGVQAG